MSLPGQVYPRKNQEKHKGEVGVVRPRSDFGVVLPDGVTKLYQFDKTSIGDNTDLHDSRKAIHSGQAASVKKAALQHVTIDKGSTKPKRDGSLKIETLAKTSGSILKVSDFFKLVSTPLCVSESEDDCDDSADDGSTSAKKTPQFGKSSSSSVATTMSVADDGNDKCSSKASKSVTPAKKRTPTAAVTTSSDNAVCEGGPPSKRAKSTKVTTPDAQVHDTRILICDALKFLSHLGSLTIKPGKMQIEFDKVLAKATMASSEEMQEVCSTMNHLDPHLQPDLAEVLRRLQLYAPILPIIDPPVLSDGTGSTAPKVVEALKKLQAAGEISVMEDAYYSLAITRAVDACITGRQTLEIADVISEDIKDRPSPLAPRHLPRATAPTR